MVENQGWVYRDQEDQDDYGIDAEVEIVENASVTGRIFKAQVRGRSPKWSKGMARHRVKRTTYELWRALPVPVFVLIHDSDTARIYWTMSSEATAARGTRT